MSGRSPERPSSGARGGPSIAAIPFRERTNGQVVPLMSDHERILLAQIASLVRFAGGTTIYREGDRADFAFNIAEGVVKTFRTLPDGTRRIAAFLFPDDLIGLAEEGVYVNEAAAVTAVAAYRLPLPALENLVRTDPSLDYQLLLKLTHELREAQRHSLILARHDAVGKVAMFIHMTARLQQAKGLSPAEIYLPMTRTDIADYIGVSLAAASRAFRTLRSRNIIRFSDRRHLQILDMRELGGLVSASENSGDDGRSA
jgi:CRP/FNR family transcriptional regulator, anaerobic regulatory protein